VVWGGAQMGELAEELLDGGSQADSRILLPSPPECSESCPGGSAVFPSRMRLTAPHVAYLKIAEGCDRFCTFCTIPKIRGKYVSRPLEELVAEARALAAAERTKG